MQIFLHNSSHNGDILHTLEFVRIIINSNPSYNFELVPACSYFLYNDMLDDRITLRPHKVIWDVDNKNKFNGEDVISNNYNVLWNNDNDGLYINVWRLLVEKNHNCISLKNRVEYIVQTLADIYAKTNIQLHFNCSDYKLLIPTLPFVDVSNYIKTLKSYNKEIILFYNLNSQCGIESTYPKNYNNLVLQELINLYPNSLIVTVKPNCVDVANVISLETDLGIKPTVDGRNLVETAHIANECNHVYFKINGGSLFILNKNNILNSTLVKYHLLADSSWHDVIADDYGLNYS